MGGDDNLDFTMAMTRRATVKIDSFEWKEIFYQEYIRMRELARKMFYRMMNEMYARLRRERKNPNDSFSTKWPLVSQEYFAVCDIVEQTFENILPGVLVDLILQHHHIYE